MHFISMCALLRRHVEARAVSVLLHSRARARDVHCTCARTGRAVAYLALCTPVRHYLARALCSYFVLRGLCALDALLLSQSPPC